MADVEKIKKIVPFVTCEITFGQYVCELMFGVAVPDLNFRIKVRPIFDFHLVHHLVVVCS